RVGGDDLSDVSEQRDMGREPGIHADPTVESDLRDIRPRLVRPRWSLKLAVPLPEEDARTRVERHVVVDERVAIAAQADVERGARKLVFAAAQRLELEP